MTEIVHGLGDDKRTCHCGERWASCEGWWAQQSDMVLDPDGKQALLHAYRDAPPEEQELLEAEWDRRSKCSTLI